MKRFVILFLVLLLAAVSCGEGGTMLPEDTDRALLPQTTEQVNFETEKLVIAGDVYENTLYYLVEDQAAVHTLDLTTGEKATLMQAVSAFSNGEMSAAECAEILCEEFVYKLKG